MRGGSKAKLLDCKSCRTREICRPSSGNEFCSKLFTYPFDLFELFWQILGQLALRRLVHFDLHASGEFVQFCSLLLRFRKIKFLGLWSSRRFQNERMFCNLQFSRRLR